MENTIVILRWLVTIILIILTALMYIMDWEAGIFPALMASVVGIQFGIAPLNTAARAVGVVLRRTTRKMVTGNSGSVS